MSATNQTNHKEMITIRKAMNKFVITLLLPTQFLLHLSKAVSLKNIETPAPACVEPVSYTHLDVYKRQVVKEMAVQRGAKIA